MTMSVSRAVLLSEKYKNTRETKNQVKSTGKALKVELLKPFLLKIRDNVYGNLIRNKKVRGKKYFRRIP